MNKKLYRSQSDKMIMGVAGGIAQYFGLDSTLVRIALVFLEFATAGLLIIAYFIVAFIIPKEPISDIPPQPDTQPKS